MKPISIIIPVYNEAESIKGYLATLQPIRQECELLLVDGGSTDHTVLQAQGSVDRMLNSVKGRSRQMNYGALYAEGDILLFLHADTLLQVEAIPEIRQAIAKGADWGRFDVLISGTHPILRVIAFFMNQRSKLTGFATGDQGIFVKRNVFKQIGGFPDIPLMEDIALSKTLNKISAPCCLASKVTTSGRRWESFGIARTILLMWWLRLNFFCGRNPEILAELYQGGHFWKH